MSNTEFYKGNTEFLLLCANKYFSVYMVKLIGTDKTSYHLVCNDTTTIKMISNNLKEIKQKGGF